MATDMATDMERFGKYMEITAKINHINSMSANDLVSYYKYNGIKDLVWQLAYVPGANHPCYSEKFGDAVIAEYEKRYGRRTMIKLTREIDEMNRRYHHGYPLSFEVFQSLDQYRKIKY